MKKQIKIIISSFLALLLSISCLSGIPKAEAEEPVYEVGTAEELLYYVELGGGAQTYEGYTIRLTADINLNELPEADKGKIIRFGHNSDAPFKGTFDGAGHTIEGLKNEKSVLPDHDLGLFGWTDGAVIKDLTLENPVVDCAYRGGILVGHAANTTIENISIHGGKLKIQPANNVVSLITNVGFSGGAVAGSIDNTTLYNCEVRGTEVVNNSTQGIAALGGEGLYMGGIVGSAGGGSVIEYCRMDDGVQFDDNGNLRMVESTVRNEYDVAVGALGGKAVYAGGIAGEIKGGSSIIDSYSTADVYVYCATYLAVGAGNVAYAGGVAAEVYGGNCKIERCHYAGNVHTKQYNAILFIPIIQEDEYISGVAQYSESSDITNSYFQRSASNTGKTFYAINDKADTETCSSLTDEQYADREFWKGKGYDLTGTIERTTGAMTEPHFNKWVMDYKRGIPIHGNSVSAALDFPQAGSVTIDGTELAKNSMEGYPADADCSVTTIDAYSFAVQGFDTYEKKVDITTEASEVKDQTNTVHKDAYKFAGWYLRRDNLDDAVTQVKNEYESLTENYNKENLVGTEKTYTAGADADYPLEDNDLYIAHYQANVVFYDVDGEEIDNGYYNYQDLLPEIEVDIPEGCTFYGWTDVPSADGKGYSGITSDVLTNLISGGNIYQSGEQIEKPLKLYPIFTDYKSNVATIMEGHEAQNEYMRDYVGTTGVKVDNTTGELYIEVTGLDENNQPMYDENNNPVFQDGYRFLGWYDENGHRVSTQTRYSLDGIDLSVKHTYTARLEYRVEYWINTEGTSDNLPDKDGDWYRYGEFWQEYESNFRDIALHFSYNQQVDWWGDAKDGGTHWKGDMGITNRLTVYGQNGDTGSGDYNIIVLTDFPGAGTITQNGRPSDAGGMNITASPDNGFNFKGWGYEEYRVYGSAYANGKWSTANLYNLYELDMIRHFYLEAHYTTNINFHWKSDNDSAATRTVERGYHDPVLLETALTGVYTAPVSGGALSGDGVAWNRQESPTADEVTRDGYYFLGWIDKTSLSQAEVSYIFDIDEYTTSNASKALPYLLNKENLAEKPLDVYAVYAKIDIETTTNIKEAGVPENSDINIPADPSYLLTRSDEDSSVTLTLETDIKTPVTNNDSDTLYVLKYVECITNPGSESETVQRLTPDVPGGNTFTLKKFDLGPSYKFIAYYEPLTLVYHLNDPETDSEGKIDANIQVEIRNTGQRIGKSPEPEYAENKIDGGMYSFVGWTTAKPADSSHCYYLMSSRDEDIYIAEAADIVQYSMEFYPAYAKADISVNSDIDDKLDNAEGVRYLERDDKTGEFRIHAEENVTGNDSQRYVFTGWTVTRGSAPEEFSSQNDVVVTEVFDGAVYTAHYEEGHTVTYHKWNEEEQRYDVLYTAGVTGERTFIQTIQGENPDGTPAEEYISVPYDTEAFIRIMSSLNAGQYFDEWQWIKEDGTVVSWDEFKDQNITQDMQLYPVIWQTKVFDSQDKEMMQDGQNAQVYVNASLSSDEPGHEKKVSVYFAGVYSQEKLTVNVSRQSKQTEGVFAGIEDITADVYNEYRLEEGEPDPDNPDEIPEPVMTGDYMASEKTDENGDAVFVFDGKLTIEKKLASGEISDGPFIFKINRLDENGQSVETCSVVVNAEEAVTLTLPFGAYSVEEDNGWAWRYSSAFTSDTYNPDGGREGKDTRTGGADGSGWGTETVYINSYSSIVTCTNTEDNGNWFDFGTNTENVFRSDEQQRQ